MSTLPPFAVTNLQTADWRICQQTPSDQIAWLKLRIERCGKSNFHEARSLVPHLQAQLDQLQKIQNPTPDDDLMVLIHDLSAVHDDDMLYDVLSSLLPIEREGAAYEYAAYLRRKCGTVKSVDFIKKQWNRILTRIAEQEPVGNNGEDDYYNVDEYYHELYSDFDRG